MKAIKNLSFIVVAGLIGCSTSKEAVVVGDSDVKEVESISKTVLETDTLENSNDSIRNASIKYLQQRGVEPQKDRKKVEAVPLRDSNSNTPKSKSKAPN